MKRFFKVLLEALEAVGNMFGSLAISGNVSCGNGKN